MAQQALDMMTTLKHKTGLSFRHLSQKTSLRYARLMRWRGRARKGLPLLQKPGPKKTKTPPFEALWEAILQLRYRAKRSLGSGALYLRFHQCISRRDLSAHITEERRSRITIERMCRQQIQWLVPNTAWSIDGTDYHRDQQGHKLLITPVIDLCSRYRYEALIGMQTNGTQVAGHLLSLFDKHGAPLFCKRDNGSIFNCHEVDAVFSRFGVIPLNSPPYYPPYNGAMERSIREIKEDLAAALPDPEQWDLSRHSIFINQVIRAENYKPRRCLGGFSAQEIMNFNARRSPWSRQERHEIFLWIFNCFYDSVTAADLEMQALDLRSLDALWRRAAESWLRRQGLINSCANKQVLPCFPQNLSHN